MTDQRFLHENHVRRGEDFKRAYQFRAVASDRNLVVFGHTNGLEYSRLGLSVSRKVGGAVRRNRWKRLLREAYRLSLAQLPPGIDLIVIPRRDVEPELHRLCRSLPALARRVGKKVGKRSV